MYSCLNSTPTSMLGLLPPHLPHHHTPRGIFSQSSAPERSPTRTVSIFVFVLPSLLKVAQIGTLKIVATRVSLSPGGPRFTLDTVLLLLFCCHRFVVLSHKSNSDSAELQIHSPEQGLTMFLFCFVLSNKHLMLL